MKYSIKILSINLISIIFLSLVTGCTIQPKFNYVNKNIDKKSAYHELKIQESKCIIEINKTLSEPMPINCTDEQCKEQKEKDKTNYLTLKEKHFKQCMNKHGYEKSYLNF